LKTTLDPSLASGLDAPITAEEVNAAISAMPKGRVPGPDGITSKFFQVIFDLVTPLLVDVFNDAWNAGTLPPDFLLGDIVLLAKKGDPADLNNKRPIMLLNLKYKLFAKVWQRRLTPIAQQLIQWNQSAFLHTCSIHHTILFCSEALHSPRFELMLKAITRGTQSQLLVNVIRGPPFDLNQSVRQGCPLSRIIFNFAMHSLSCAITAEQASGKLRGLALPDSVEYLQSSYSDDTHLILAADTLNVLAAKTLMDTSSAATGLTIN
jgi:hypothetical protein